jgi:murein DD-endopeptidase MepM/ murein hydrolase activator NlpD
MIAVALALVIAMTLPLSAAWGASAARDGDLRGTSTGQWPLQPRPEVVAGFAPPAQQWLSGHRGVDLRGRPGQQVLAALTGRVAFAGPLAGRGVVVVEHGQTRTTYQPVQASVRRGAMVTAGQPLGRLQTFGSHCWPGSCLHWGLLRGETYLNPLTLVGASPVRLLPLSGASLLPGPTGKGAPPWAPVPLPVSVDPSQPSSTARGMAPAWRTAAGYARG